MTYDAKGNLTTNSNGQTYTWDFNNKMQSATVPVGCADGIEGTHTYGYDALGTEGEQDGGWQYDDFRVPHLSSGVQPLGREDRR
jgi:hypothetical protein